MSAVPRRHRLRGDPERCADRDGAHHVRQVVKLTEAELERRLAQRAHDLGAHRVVADLVGAGEDESAGAERDRLERRRDVGLERLGIGRDHRASLVAEAGEDLGLGLRDRLERAEQLEMDGADVGDRGDIGLGDLAELGDLPEAPHRHLEHERLGLGRRREDRQRQPDLGVEVLGAGVDARGQQRSGDVLDRRLAGRSGDPHHLAVELAAPLAGQALKGEQRIRRREYPGAAGIELSHAPARRLRPRRRPRWPAAANSPPSLLPAGEPEEQIARPHEPRIDLGLHGPAIAALGGDVGPNSFSDPLGRELDHVRAPGADARARSCSEATSRSSNGILRPCSNSWPCS